MRKKILIVIGQHHAFSPADKAAIEPFAAAHDVAIYVNHNSNFNGNKAVHGNLRLAAGGFAGLQLRPPTCHIHLGAIQAYPCIQAVASSQHLG